MMNQHVCRCCLLENPMSIYNIFVDNLYLQLLQCVPNLNIEPDDGLSDIICGKCWLQLNEALKFRFKCMETERELKERYDDTNKAIEVALGSNILEPMDHVSFDSLLTELIKKPTDDEETHVEQVDKYEPTTPDDFLLEDYSFSSITDIKTCVTKEDPVINEILENVINDPNFENVLKPYPLDELMGNSANEVTSETPKTFNFNTHQPSPKISTNEINTKKSHKSLHPCPECGKKFTRNFQLKLHMISVHNLGDGLQYKCEECQKMFASRHSLNYHYKSIHTVERPFACVHCHRRFVLRTQLASHMRTHTGQLKPRIHECAVCGKYWPTKSDLKTHMRSHDPKQKRPFKCDRCGKSFFTRSHLNSHELVHSGEKPFACVFCEKSYQSAGNLNNHIIRNHSEELLDKMNQGTTFEI